MKWTLLIFVLLFSACAELTRYPAAKVEIRHVVFDIDWTIVSELKVEHYKKIPTRRVIEVDGHKYFIHEGLEEFIKSILDKKNVKISFYSGGERIRNKELLSKIKLSDGRSLADIALKILSKEELTALDVSPELRFSERYKKDLSRVTPDLNQLIMLDDTYDFVLETNQPQREHVFFVGSSFEHFESFKDTKDLVGKYIPQTYNEWLLNRNKLYILNRAFNIAYDEADNSNITFSEAMKKQEELLNLKSQQWNEVSERYYQFYFQTDLQLKPQESFKCTESIKLLIGP